MAPRLASHSLPAEAADPVSEAVERLQQALPPREDSKVLVDFLADDLREGFDALADVEAHFSEVLDLLRSGRLTPITLLEVSEDYRVLERLEYLMVIAAQLRRRMSQAAGKIRVG